MNQPHATRIMLSDNPSLGRLEVDLEAFFEFSFWIAEELEDLVATRRHETRSTTARPVQTP